MENNKNIEVLETIEEISPSVIYQQDKASIDTQIATAKAFPRDMQRAIKNSITIVTLDVKTAETCNYALPRGGKTLTGPSVHLAKILAQNWGNLRIDAKVVSIDAKHVTSESVCFDLENNLAIKTQVKRSIMTKAGRMSDDMITVTGNAANAVAMRNAILSVIPRPIVDKVYNAAKQTITGDISDANKLLAKRTQVFTQLKNDYKVSDKEILQVIGKEAESHVTSDDLVVLIGVNQSIKDGDTTVAQVFKNEKTPSKEVVSLEDLQLIFNLKKEFLSSDDTIAIERIIKNNEVASFKKAKTILDKL